MFGNKKSKEIETKKEPVAVTTIPAEFYAGTNPVVKFKNIEKEIDLRPDSPLSKRDKKLLDKETAAGSNQPLHPVNLFSNRRFLILGSLVIFIGIIVGGGIYYVVFQNHSPNPPISSHPNTTSTQVSVSSTPTSSIEITPTTSPEISTSSVFSEPSIDFPSVTLGDSIDTDNDGLGDKEEELFSTDLGVPDTDNDGYPDGHEVFYLYNPAGKEPMRIIDSGAVKEFINPVLGYKLYYPTTWAVGSVDPEYQDVLFSTITGENVEVRTFSKQAGEDFAAWFVRAAPREKYDDLVDFSSYFKDKGRSRKDSLVYYFETLDKVYVLVFHTTDSSVVNYRSVVKMMARSFQVPGNVGPSPTGDQVSTSSVLISASSTEILIEPSATSSITSTAL